MREIRNKMVRRTMRAIEVVDEFFEVDFPNGVARNQMKWNVLQDQSITALMEMSLLLSVAAGINSVSYDVVPYSEILDRCLNLAEEHLEQFSRSPHVHLARFYQFYILVGPLSTTPSCISFIQYLQRTEWEILFFRSTKSIFASTMPNHPSVQWTFRLFLTIFLKFPRAYK